MLMVYSFYTDLLCHGLKQGVNKLSGRHCLLTPTLQPEEGKRRKKEGDLQIEYKKLY